jgi:biopolymer transport protein TolR
MSSRLTSKRKGPLAEINVVPYIDVMLVLLVIFMITAPLLTQGINVKLPSAQAKTISAEKDIPIVVSIDKSGRYFLNTATNPSVPILQQELLYQVAALLRVAEEQHKTRPVYVKGDKDVDYGSVVQVMSLLQKAGAENIGLITQNLEQGSPDR